jgi:hypothetical protein
MWNYYGANAIRRDGVEDGTSPPSALSLVRKADCFGSSRALVVQIRKPQTGEQPQA